MTRSPTARSSGTALFVRRPILAFVLSALIVIAGLAGLFGAEIRELPNVDRPVVTVTTAFPGASPETVDQELTGRIEGAVGRVSGIRSISSNSRFGRSRVTLEFAGSVDIDVAATDVRDAVARIAPQLPDEAEEPSIVKADADASPVMRIAVTSSGRSPQELTRIVQERVEDRLISVEGVADLQIYGDREPIFRVDIDQLALASRGLTLADVARALEDVAFDAPAGDLTGDRQSIAVRTTATVSTAEAFEALQIAPDVRMRDVARVTLGPAPNETILRANGQSGLGMGVIRQATSNTLEISAAVHDVVAELDKSLPDDVSIFVTSDDARFIQGSIDEVVKTLGLAVAIVVVVIFVFLRSASATLIPALTLPVALIGTLAAIYLVGFSINILTLLALVLATGMVVDDAIVVLENIVRRRAEGMGPRAAGVLAAGLLRGGHHDGDAGRRVHPALLPARTGGGAFPRIRLHAGDVGHVVFGGRIDPVPGARQPVPVGATEGGRKGADDLAREPACVTLPADVAGGIGQPGGCAAGGRTFRVNRRVRGGRRPSGTDPAGGSRGGAPADHDAAGRSAGIHQRQDAGSRGRGR